jgi:hypothetical protein
MLGFYIISLFLYFSLMKPGQLEDFLFSLLNTYSSIGLKYNGLSSHIISTNYSNCLFLRSLKYLRVNFYKKVQLIV